MEGAFFQFHGLEQWILINNNCNGYIAIELSLSHSSRKQFLTKILQYIRYMSNNITLKIHTTYSCALEKKNRLQNVHSVHSTVRKKRERKSKIFYYVNAI